MVKRKFSEDFDAEELDDSQADASSSRGRSRVRKKSAKLIEMEEFEEEIVKVAKESPQFSVLPKFGKQQKSPVSSPGQISFGDLRPDISVPAKLVIDTKETTSFVSTRPVSPLIKGRPPVAIPVSPVNKVPLGESDVAAQEFFQFKGGHKIKSKAAISGKVVEEMALSRPKPRPMIKTPVKRPLPQEDDNDDELPESVIKLLLSSPSKKSKPKPTLQSTETKDDPLIPSKNPDVSTTNPEKKRPPPGSAGQIRKKKFKQATSIARTTTSSSLPPLQSVSSQDTTVSVTNSTKTKTLVEKTDKNYDTMENSQKTTDINIKKSNYLDDTNENIQAQKGIIRTENKLSTKKQRSDQSSRKAHNDSKILDTKKETTEDSFTEESDLVGIHVRKPSRHARLFEDNSLKPRITETKKPKIAKLESLDDHDFASVLQSGDVIPEKISKKKSKKKNVTPMPVITTTSKGVTATFKDLKSIEIKERPKKKTLIKESEMRIDMKNKSSDIPKVSVHYNSKTLEGAQDTAKNTENHAPGIKVEAVKQDLLEPEESRKVRETKERNEVKDEMRKLDAAVFKSKMSKMFPIPSAQDKEGFVPKSILKPTKNIPKIETAYKAETDLTASNVQEKPIPQSDVPPEKLLSPVKISKAKQRKDKKRSISVSDNDERGELSLSEGKKSSSKKSPKKPKIKKTPIVKKSPRISSPEPVDVSDDSIAAEPTTDESFIENEKGVTNLAMKLKTSKEKKAVKSKKKDVTGADGDKKTKQPRAPTAYTLFCQSQRSKVLQEAPGLDFANMSRTLGDMWKALPEKEKALFRTKARKGTASKGSTLISTGKVGSSQNGPPMTARQAAAAARAAKGPNRSRKSSGSRSGGVQDDDDLPEKLPGCAPIDAAAHLKLLGESLGIIGQRLQEHKGLIAVQGSLSVLLDSVLCAFGPLLSLTQVIDETNGCSAELHSQTLDNIAYIMPGL